MSMYLIKSTKICTKCKIEKTVDNFRINLKNKNGLHSWCRECVATGVREYYKKYPEKRREVNVKNHTNNKETMQLLIERKKPIITKQKKEWRIKNKNKLQVQEKIYNSSPAGKATNARKNHTKRVRIASTINDLTAEEFQHIIELQGNKCNICKRLFSDTLKPHRDHIVPLSAGGGLTSNNVQALCQSCNSSKLDKLHKGFIQTWCCA